MSLKSTARAYLRDAMTAFDRAPAEVALAVLSAVLVSYAIEGEFRFEAWMQMAVGIFITFAFAWTATLLYAMGAIDMRRRWIVTSIGALAAVSYLLVVDDITHEAEMWRMFMLVVGCALLVFAAPAWATHPTDPSLRLRRINGRFVLRALGIGLYGLALFGGLALALAAVDNLFELELKEQIYAHVFGWIMLVLVPWVVVGGLESYVEPLDRVSDVARVVHRLASFLVPPLIVLYFAILFVYAARILTTGELPKNLVSPMVLAAGLLSAVAAVLFDPQPNDPRAGHRILRLAPIFFLPVAPLGFWALTTRTVEYGLTEFRLLRLIGLVLLVALAVLGAVQLVRRRPFSLRVIPALLGVAMLLSAVGPWSVLAVSRRDQQHRLNDALRAASIDPARPAPVDTTRSMIARELYERINNTAMYLQSHFGEESLPLRYNGYDFAGQMGLTPAVADTFPTHMYGVLPANAPVTTAAGTVYRVTENNVLVTQQDSLSIIRLRRGYFADVTELLAQMARSMGGAPPRRIQGQLPARSVAVFDSTRQTRGELIILDAMAEQKKDTTRFNRIDGILIIR